MRNNKLLKIIIIVLISTIYQYVIAKELNKNLIYDRLLPSAGWKVVADGIELKEIILKRPNWYGFGLTEEDIKSEGLSVEEIQKIEIKVMRVDPKKVKLRMIYCSDYKEKTGTDIKNLVRKSGAIGAVTGGYYAYEKDNQTLKPVGILIVDGRQVSGWLAGVNGIFVVMKNGAAEIIPKENYKKSPDILQAVQAGPTLVKNGEIKIVRPLVFNEFKLRPRTAVGITGDKKVLMLAVETGLNGLSLYELAEIMKGLGCVDALNMDGGPSAQMFMGQKNFEVHVKGVGKIINAIGFFEK